MLYGNEIEVPTTSLTTGNTTSCGCLNIDILKQVNQYVDGTSLRQALENNPKSNRNMSGYTGVSPKKDKWAARITYKGKRYYLGTYSKLEDAVEARAKAKQEIILDA